MSFYKIKGEGILEILFIISMMSPNFIGAYSWILLLGRSGTVTKFLSGLGIHVPSIYGFGGMLLVFSLKLYPFIYMYVSGALKKIDVALTEAAESLGCSGLRKVFTVIMPLVTPTLVAAALLVFMNMVNLAMLLSVSLGVMNLLPLPALDGGRLIFLLLEVIRGKPIPPEKEGIIHFAGFVALMILMIFVMFNDIQRIVG